jgi:hypothetical protein
MSLALSKTRSRGEKNQRALVNEPDRGPWSPNRPGWRYRDRRPSNYGSFAQKISVAMAAAITGLVSWRAVFHRVLHLTN